MNKKIELSIFGAVAVILLFVCVFSLVSSDKKGPVIEFDKNEQVTYVEGQEDTVLLSGVTAVDKKDGNVSDSLIVVSKIVLADKQSLKVTYAAKDKQNNVTKAERIVDYVPSDSNNGENNSTENGENGENGENVSGGEGSALTQSTEPETTTGDTQPAGTGPTGEIDKMAADASGIPVIKLNAAEGSITAGQDFDAISYVRETYDNSGDVSRRIRVTGDYDLNTPGDYELNYLVSDTEGNVSEPAVFILHVLPKTDNGNAAGETNTTANPDENQNPVEGGEQSEQQNPDGGNQDTN